MIQMHFSSKEDLIYPVVVCDQCGERIVDATMAHVLLGFPDFAAPPPYRVPPLAFVHKQCSTTVERAYERTTSGSILWLDLYEFVGQLAYRVGLEQSDARRLSARTPWTGAEGAADE
jgi:hypothetical protein